MTAALFTAEDEFFMSRALFLGGRNRTGASPNPSVGCVVVNDGKIVGEGATAAGGRPHAEFIAINNAGFLANGATLYVTLEPCCHSGRGISCVDAIIQAGIKKVIAATEDLDSRVGGAGLKKLAELGIDARKGLRKEQADIEHEAFFKRVTSGLPFITVNLGMTLDNKIATLSSANKLIPFDAMRQHMRHSLVEMDAVLIDGCEHFSDILILILQEIPINRRPAFVILAPECGLIHDSFLVPSGDKFKNFLLHEDVKNPFKLQHFINNRVFLLNYNISRNGDLRAALHELVKLGFNNVLCGGGTRLADLLLKGRLVDRLRIFSSGKNIGQPKLTGHDSDNILDLLNGSYLRLDSIETVRANFIQTWERINERL
ncbi:riboflavin biosynthesis protein RibD [Agrobacterium vitis]|uniref:bifunctional diaminohydroxyphosphoribosylaminopyrimidine deaminase/5-amino-6-(5-phosphoribosylamino)uracil reductase RibD n=1 Tax=Agrobacterium vitis TaxID=373 RepID=UPI0015D70F12|nr:bifunctional diaminohydroxyphosphoribosylaminopyrimidine deaminase/5-amino-6-(5-phosphoribosylamino)uracil reductase RibD [Agrobacterium vitis]BCH60793.1 riboflavin biosynthesis protein RibD [Agrobacterium vitis]